MSLANENIEHLILLCKQNNQKAQLEVYNRYCKAMYNVALRIVKDEHFAEDVMQEGFLKAFQKLDTFRNEVAFGAWLKRIIINYSIDFYKKNSFFNHDDFETKVYKIEDEPEDESIDYTNLKVQEVLNAIQNLKESYRMILTLVFIEGFDLEEVCEILNISYANCRTTMSRAKESLRMQLAVK
ncbi:RNA polymerase sigma factor [Flavobacterium sp. UBA6135]|uniref:RNA polymerase sigma factor n=1 Tax=Flavobacterium sp. UBA6135 TaxID=1946553 RepID=UPI0025C4860A|nr:sigma-70 family RNA polymerase sigma factor [Flavobacterium sp. UBA6135]